MNAVVLAVPALSAFVAVLLSRMAKGEEPEE